MHGGYVGCIVIFVHESSLQTFLLPLYAHVCILIIYAHGDTYTYVHAQTCVCVYVYVHICVYVYTYMCNQIRKHVCVYIYIHIHIYTALGLPDFFTEARLAALQWQLHIHDLAEAIFLAEPSRFSRPDNMGHCQNSL